MVSLLLLLLLLLFIRSRRNDIAHILLLSWSLPLSSENDGIRPSPNNNHNPKSSIHTPTSDSNVSPLATHRRIIPVESTHNNPPFFYYSKGETIPSNKQLLLPTNFPPLLLPLLQSNFTSTPISRQLPSH